MKTIILVVFCIIFFTCNIVYAEKQYDDEEICQAIYMAEGEERASQPYGINPEYIKCDSKVKCKQICLNTVRNNKRRYKEYGFNTHNSYLSFLASRYCPISEPNCQYWLKNVKYYLEKGK